MDISVIDDIITWLKDFRDDKVHFTFHGGEPLLAGYDFYAQALEKLSKIDNVEGFSLQSNIWLLSDELIDLFLKYNVVVSTMIIKEQKVILKKPCQDMKKQKKKD